MKKKYVQMNEVSVRTHNEIMSIYASDEQNQRMQDTEIVSYEVDRFGDRIYTD